MSEEVELDPEEKPFITDPPPTASASSMAAAPIVAAPREAPPQPDFSGPFPGWILVFLVLIAILITVCVEEGRHANWIVSPDANETMGWQENTTLSPYLLIGHSVAFWGFCALSTAFTWGPRGRKNLHWWFRLLNIVQVQTEIIYMLEVGPYLASQGHSYYVAPYFILYNTSLISLLLLSLYFEPK